MINCCGLTIFLSQIAELLDVSSTHCILNVFPSHRDRTCREKYYELLHCIWDRRDELAEGLATQLKQYLIRSLSDDSAAIRKRAHQFWDHHER